MTAIGDGSVEEDGIAAVWTTVTVAAIDAVSRKFTFT